MEKWKSVEGFAGLYEVSDSGNVRSASGKVTFSERHGKRKWKQRTLKQTTDIKGYKRVTLYKEKKKRKFLVHRLVAIAFCENPNGEKLVSHEDGNPSNNYFGNLKWCSYSYNLLHAYEKGLNNTPIGIVLINLKTKEENSFRSMAEAGKFLGKNHGYISRILKENKSIKGYSIQVIKKGGIINDGIQKF